MNIGLVGAGAVANFLLEEINLHKLEDFQITSILVREQEKYWELESKYAVNLFTDVEAFLQSNIDLVVEAANVNAVKQLLPSVIKKKDVIVLSVGAFADETLLKEICQLTKEYQYKVHMPSGAIGGLDLLQNAQAVGTVQSVSLTTRKPASALVAEELETEIVVFKGKAVDAIKKFPKNMNVSIVLAMAGLGVENTNVCLVADPKIEKNIHHIHITGDFGEATFTIANNPLPTNPNTSYLAAMSIIGTIKRINSKLNIGG